MAIKPFISNPYRTHAPTVGAATLIKKVEGGILHGDLPYVMRLINQLQQIQVENLVQVFSRFGILNSYTFSGRKCTAVDKSEKIEVLEYFSTLCREYIPSCT